MTAMTRAELDHQLGVTLTDEQWACVSAPPEPFVIVAGAGTGKTSVMAARVLWLVASGLVAEHQVLGLTFTNKAAAELAHRIRTLLTRWRSGRPPRASEPEGEPTIATYHSFARRLIDEQGLRLGVEPGARLLSGVAVAQLAYRVVCRADGLRAARHAPATLASAVITLDANLAEQTISTAELRAHDRQVIARIDAMPSRTKPVDEIRDTAVRRIELADLVDRLRDERRRVGGLDFSDHMRLCVDLVRGSEQLVAELRGTYRVVLLDEYQDTSIAQRVILATLFAGSAVTAVGDPLQAIYGWRSASVANIAAFGAHFGVTNPLAGPPRSNVRVLSVNRRSADEILGAANRVAAALRTQHPEVAPLRAPAPRIGLVRAALLPTVADEREWVADQVLDLLDAGRAAQDVAILTRANDDLAPLQQALAVRGIPASITGAAALAASPYALAVLATLRLLHDPADNTSLITLLSGPRWRIGPADLERLAERASQLAGSVAGGRSGPVNGGSVPGGTGPGGPLPGETLPGETLSGETLSDRIRQVTRQPDPVQRPSLLEAASSPGDRVSPQAHARLARFVAEINQVQVHVGAPLAELTARVVQVLDAQVEADVAVGLVTPPSLGLPPSGSDEPTSGWSDGDAGLTGLMQLVDGFSDAEGRSGLGAFLTYLDAGEELGSGEQVDRPVLPGSVQLMTMHQAKGLEFPVVVLPHLAADVFPARKGSERWTTQAQVVPSELRDDRHVLPVLSDFTSAGLSSFAAQCRAHDRSGDDRLAYVAITRAKEVLIASGHWWGPTQKRVRGPSPYLIALRDQALEDAGQLFLADPWAEEPAGPDGSAPSNPMLDAWQEAPWPTPDLAADDPLLVAARRVEQRLGVLEGARQQGGADQRRADQVPPLSRAAARQVAAWDTAIDALLARAQQEQSGPPTVAVPVVLTASATMDLAADPQAYAAELLRPMPRRRSRQAELGTAFHAWVEARLGLQPLIADDELPGAADEGIASARELEELKVSFESLPYATRQPVGLEVPFSLTIAGRVIRGRIDAVFPAGPDAPEGERFEVVDWKTSEQTQGADPLQLAIYRLAWAQQAGVPVDQVGAAFAFVRLGRVMRPEGLPDDVELGALLGSDIVAAEA